LVTFEKLHEDKRGEIYRIEHNGKEYLLLTIKKGYIRGGDYHKTKQHDVVLMGRVAVTKYVDGKDIREEYGENQVVIMDEGVPHMIEALTEEALLLEWLEGDFEKKFFEPYRKLVMKRMEGYTS